jgi:hypothetical protein
MRLSTLMLMLLASGCTNATLGSLEALADASRQARAAHAKALAATADDRVAITGANLIEILDAGFGSVEPQ